MFARPERASSSLPRASTRLTASRACRRRFRERRFTSRDRRCAKPSSRMCGRCVLPAASEVQRDANRSLDRARPAYAPQLLVDVGPDRRAASVAGAREPASVTTAMCRGSECCWSSRGSPSARSSLARSSRPTAPSTIARSGALARSRQARWPRPSLVSLPCSSCCSRCSSSSPSQVAVDVPWSHWPSTVGQVLFTDAALAGLTMALATRTRSLPALVLGHHRFPACPLPGAVHRPRGTTDAGHGRLGVGRQVDPDVALPTMLIWASIGLWAVAAIGFAGRRLESSLRLHGRPDLRADPGRLVRAASARPREELSGDETTVGATVLPAEDSRQASQAPDAIGIVATPRYEGWSRRPGAGVPAGWKNRRPRHRPGGAGGT